MNSKTLNPVEKVIVFFGSKAEVSRITGVSNVAVTKWQKKGMFPRTDYTGETSHAHKLARASKGGLTAKELLPTINQ